MNRKEIQQLQHGLNIFTHKYLKGINRIVADGKMGASTRGRIRTCKYYLGYLGDPKINMIPNQEFLQRLWHPKSTKYSTSARIARGVKRRIKQRAEATKQLRSSLKATGVGRFDGVPVASWLIPYLQWARDNGWNGRLVSGWRDPAYSESLCYRICGAPRCPGRCAGRSSNHSGSAVPHGAVDVSDYDTFGRVIARCPLRPKIINTLGARDPVHFSVSGQ